MSVVLSGVGYGLYVEAAHDWLPRINLLLPRFLQLFA